MTATFALQDPDGEILAAMTGAGYGISRPPPRFSVAAGSVAVAAFDRLEWNFCRSVRFASKFCEGLNLNLFR